MYQMDPNGITVGLHGNSSYSKNGINAKLHLPKKPGTYFSRDTIYTLLLYYKPVKDL